MEERERERERERAFALCRGLSGAAAPPRASLPLSPTKPKSALASRDSLSSYFTDDKAGRTRKRVGRRGCTPIYELETDKCTTWILACILCSLRLHRLRL